MSAKRVDGFGLIELMVSIVIGLIVMTGIISLVVATLRANTENLEMTRLNQEMRSVMQLVTRDLRRGGYTQQAIRDFGSGNQSNNDFTGIRVFDGSTELDYADSGITEADPADCVLFSYDSDGNGDAEAGEFRGFKYDAANNAIRAKVSGNASDADCADGTGTWETLTDTATVQVNEFAITTRNGNAVPVMTDSAGNPVLTIRELVISLDAQLAEDDGVRRTMRETVRVRNDLLN